MFDLFGLSKKEDAPAAEAAPAGADEYTPAPMADGEPHEPPPRGSHKLWAFLLVLDSVFVIVFAGAVAAKVYQHWNAPSAPVVPAPRRRNAPAPAAVPAAVAPAAASTETPKAPEPPKAAEAKPSKTPDARPGEAPQRPPKPSMLTEAPRRREVKPSEAGPRASASAPAAKAPAAAAASDAKTKAVKTEFKVRAPKAKAVELVGAFIVRGGRREMTRQDDGTWTVTLYLNPGSYRYFFSVDKKKELDPENPHSEKGASLLSVP